MSSMTSSLAMPGPGPGTVRQALISVAAELFGLAYTRDVIFPVARSMGLHIRPPKSVALSNQFLQMYKGEWHGLAGHSTMEPSIGYREMAHATGEMTVYINIPAACEHVFSELLSSVGYWGQASSFTCCLSIRHEPPQMEECATPLRLLKGGFPIRRYFSCIVTDFQDQRVKWEDILPILRDRIPTALRMELYIWPMIIEEKRRAGTLLRRAPLALFMQAQRSS